MPKQNIGADLPAELRSVHSGLHAALDALLKQYDPNECGRILMTIDERLTEIINRQLTIPPAAQPAIDPVRAASLQLHQTWSQSGAADVIAAAAREAGRPLEVTLRDDGIDLVSPGLPQPVATIRVEVTKTTLLRFRPDLGLGPTVAEQPDVGLEAWAREASEMWRRVVRTARETAPKDARDSVAKPELTVAKKSPDAS